MDRAASLISPGSKILAGWYRQLAALKPRRIWVGYIYLHRIEAPVEVLREQPVDPLILLILQAINAAPVNEFDRWLGLPPAVLANILQSMQRENLIARANDNCWAITERGKLAVDRQSVPVHSTERQVLPFVERLDQAGQRVGPPLFLAIGNGPRADWIVDDAHSFDSGILQTCIKESNEWKAMTRFPTEIERFGIDAATDWQRVIVDHPERMMTVFLTTEQELLGFAIKVEGWSLNERSPVLRLPSAALPGLSALLTEPTDEAWRDAWRAWCKQRSLPANEVEACKVALASARVEIQAPPRLVQRLQAANNELLKGDAWLLVGEGYIRPAAPMAMKTA